MTEAQLLPLIFVALMGLATLAYVILDGYDLGVGILMARATDAEKDSMIASIGPFWDANETWLVFSLGIMLVAFPHANGLILTTLYIPVAIMIWGLILRGVSFDFRAKAKDKHKHLWDKTFIAGSLFATYAQGYMLGMYIMGLAVTSATVLFSMLVGLCLVSGYCLTGASWLIMKTEGTLQRRAIGWARTALWGTALGIALVSLATPLISTRIFEKWFSLPNFILLMPIPLVTGGLVVFLEVVLRKLPRQNDSYCWVPFAGTVCIFLLSFQGLAYSFYPFIVPDKMTVWDAASAPESLMFMLIGTAIVLPCIIAYNLFAYRVFRGKVSELKYY